jgi:hypothetical protein
MENQEENQAAPIEVFFFLAGFALGAILTAII